MNAEQMRIVIARHQDFYLVQMDGAFSLRHGRETTTYPWHDSEEEAWEDAPNYPNDLNDIHKIWRSLSPADRLTLRRHLKDVVFEDHPQVEELAVTMSDLIENATAQQRCRAICRLWGLEEE